MEFRKLGKSDLKVSSVGMGCMSLKSGDNNARSVIDKALDYGVNFFDTADLYEFGLNEELLGRTIGKKRQRLFIASKVGNQWTEARDGWSWNPSKAYIIEAVEASLKRLKTDYIDLYQLHGGTIHDPIDETIEAFELLKDQGKIREYGISSIRPNVIREYVKRSNIISVMMQYSLLDRRPEEEILGLLKENNIAVIVRGTLAKGLLVDKRANGFLGLSLDRVAEIQSTLKNIAAKKAVSRAAVATRYILQHEAVATAAIGFRTIAQIRDLLENFDNVKLTALDSQFLSDSPGAHLYNEHR